MLIKEMTEDERHTFGVLLRAMVGADGSTSLEESADLQVVASELGSDDFWSLMRETAGTDYPDDTLQAKASGVERREAQETIYGALFSLATAGSIVGREAKLLDWLTVAWNIETSSPDTGS